MVYETVVTIWQPEVCAVRHHTHVSRPTHHLGCQVTELRQFTLGTNQDEGWAGGLH